MSETKGEQLFPLLPAIYRQADALQGNQLQALMAGLESEFLTLEADMDALYDNWFIETCDQWVIPYLADLVGIDGISEQSKVFATQRRQVANTIAYRRRKGTPATLEHVTRDVTDWYVRAVEYGRYLAITQHLEHVLTGKGTLLDLHQIADLETLNGPFDKAAHTVDLRRISGGSIRAERNASIIRGAHQSGSIGLFIWRLQSYPLTNVPASRVTRDGHLLPAGCFTFDPLGRDMQLYNLPQEVSSITRRVEAINLPIPISQINFANDLTAYQAHYHSITSATPEQHKIQGNAQQTLSRPRNSTYYGPDRNLCVLLQGKLIPLDSIIALDLSQWGAAQRSLYQDRDLVVAIDVALGRLAFLGKEQPKDDATDDVGVSYNYGFSDDLGGGPYSRKLNTASVYVLKDGQVDKLSSALAAWHSSQFTIRIEDNGIYREDDLVINLPPGSRLAIEAANGVRPILGKLTIHSQHASTHLVLNGLLIDGELTINGNLNLEITHCTLMPHGITAQHSESPMALRQITINHSIVGPIRISDGKTTLTICDSIVDHAHDFAIDALHARPGSTVNLERVTIFGKVQVSELHRVRDVIFTQPVFAHSRKVGLVSYSFVPGQSQTPHCEHCQPAASIQHVTREQETAQASQSEQPPGGQRIYPLFTSTRYGDPAYAQLSMECAPQILRGSSAGSEMGAFYNLFQAQRQDNLSRILDEYLPLSLVPGIFYVT